MDPGPHAGWEYTLTGMCMHSHVHGTYMLTWDSRDIDGEWIMRIQRKTAVPVLFHRYSEHPHAAMNHLFFIYLFFFLSAFWFHMSPNCFYILTRAASQCAAGGRSCFFCFFSRAGHQAWGEMFHCDIGAHRCLWMVARWCGYYQQCHIV